MNPGDLSGRWNYADLPSNILVGPGCYLEDRKCFERMRSTKKLGLVLGRGVQIFCRTAFSVEPSGSICIGADTVLVGAIFECAERIEVGERVIISYNVTIADSDFHPRDPEHRRQDAIAISPHNHLRSRPPIVARPVRIDDDVRIGIGAFILKGVHIGAGAQIGAGAVVTANVPPGAMVTGNPARIASDSSGQE